MLTKMVEMILFSTHTMDIYAKAEIIDRENGEDIIVCGGYGIGVVTKGLSVDR